MDRAALLAHLLAWYPEAIEEAGFEPLDSPAGLEAILNAVEDIVADQPTLQSRWYKPLAEYFLLTRLENAFLIKFDVTLGDNEGSYRLNQLFTNIQKDLDRLRGQVGWIVDPDDGDGFFGGSVTMRSRFLVGDASGSEW